MKCNYSRNIKKSEKQFKELLPDLYSAFVNLPAVKDMQAKTYIASQSFDDEEYKELCKKYEETGELPEKKY